MTTPPPPSDKVFNFNIGILGHVDSGKTSLAKSLSTLASTAAFDKNPQSRERGITLDLGFSSCVLPMPSSLKERDDRFSPFSLLQFTFVDCPGHASLIRTIIGGAQIIDLIILVIDAIRLIQTQTAECIVLGEITCPSHLILALNKTDLLSSEADLAKIQSGLRKTLQKTSSYKTSPIVAVAANPDDHQPRNLQALIDELVSQVYFPSRSSSGPFLFCADHCFAIRGQGTVLTGTVLQGSIKVNDSVDIPSLGETKKVKSIQVFRKPVERISQGDRAGICLTQLDPKLFERGIACAQGAVQTSFGAIVSAKRIDFFKSAVLNKAKFHISVGHETVLAQCRIFSCFSSPCSCAENSFSFQQEYASRAELSTEKDLLARASHEYVLLEFEHAILMPPNAAYIASKMDLDIHSNVCRLAFHGRVLHAFVEKGYSLAALRIVKTKERQGTIERVQDEYTCIVNGLCKRETNVDLFTGLNVELSTGERGKIEGSFGQSGKVRVRIPEGLKAETVERLERATAERKARKGAPPIAEGAQKVEPVRVVLRFKQYAYDPKKSFLQ